MNDNARMAEYVGTAKRDEPYYISQDEFNDEYRKSYVTLNMTIAEYFNQNKVHWNKRYTLEVAENVMYETNKKQLVQEYSHMNLVAYREWCGDITLYTDEQGKEEIWQRCLSLIR